MKNILFSIALCSFASLVGCAADADSSNDGAVDQALGTGVEEGAVEHHVLTLDEKEGTVVRDEVVSEAEFTIARDAAAAVPDQVEAGHSMEPTIGRVPDQDCKVRTDFFKLWNNTTIANGVCFATNGTANIHVHDVYQVNTGNNAGHFVGNFAGGGNIRFPRRGEICQYVKTTFKNSAGRPIKLHTVSQVSIVGRTAPGC